MNGKELVRINDNLKADRSLWDTMWQDIADNMVFRKSSIVGKVEAGVKLTQRMYDSTATQAGQDLAAWIGGNMTGRGMDWFSLKKGGEPSENKEFQEWLEDARKLELEALRESNFASEWNEVLLDLVFFCTGALFVEENEIVKPGFNGFNFASMPPGSYSVILGRDRRAQGLFRDLQLQAQAAFERWPNKVSDEIKKDAEKAPSKMYDFVHACFPQEWFNGNHKNQGKAYASYYVAAKQKTIMQTGGYENFPFFVIPYLRESGETYGRGPGWTALPEVKTAHKVQELMLKEWALAIQPPITMVDQGVVGSPRLTPFGITIVKKDGDLKPMALGARYSDNRARQEDQRAVIREFFHGDKVRFIPPREQTGQMTAYEVARRYQMAQLLLGPTFGNIVDHGLDPLVEFCFNMMRKNGAFGDEPPDFDRPEELEIEYESPLAKAQRVTEVEAINNTLEAVGLMAEAKPDIFDNFDLDGTSVHIASMFGYPTKLVNSEEDRDELRAARAQAQQKQEALEQAALLAKAAKDGAGAMKELPEGVVPGQ